MSTARSRSVTIPTGRPPWSTSTTEPTLWSLMSAATAYAGMSGGAVTTEVVMISSIRTADTYIPDRGRLRATTGHHVRIGAVAELTPSQERTRDRFEMLIGVMAPGLSLVLAAGDRISRIVQPE